MPGDIVGRHRGSRKDELARRTAIIDGTPHVIPDPRLELPLVDESGGRTGENEARIDPSELERVVIDVEAHF